MERLMDISDKVNQKTKRKVVVMVYQHLRLVGNRSQNVDILVDPTVLAEFAMVLGVILHRCRQLDSQLHSRLT